MENNAFRDALKLLRMARNKFTPFLNSHYEIHEWKHASAILMQDFPAEWKEIVEVLTRFRFNKSWITVGGGSKSKVAQAVDSQLYDLGWEEKQFATHVVVDDRQMDSPTHKIDCFKNRVALEIE